MRIDKSKFFFFEDLSGLYTADFEVNGGSVNDEVILTNAKADVVLDIYKQLSINYPHYVSSEKIGELCGKDFNIYTFSFPQINNFTEFSVKKPEILITAGIHGYEQGSAWTLAQFCRQLCESDNKYFSFLRRNVIFKIIPLVNIWGFENNERKNENGVDINRNFDADWKPLWTPEQGNYMGTKPFSEKESRFLSEFLENNKNAEFLIDYHNIASGLPLWFVNCEEQATLCNSLFTALSAKWAGEYTALNKNKVYGACKPEDGLGKFSYYALKNNINNITLETPWCFDTVGVNQYDNITIKLSLEVLVNTILSLVKLYM